MCRNVEWKCSEDVRTGAFSTISDKFNRQSTPPVYEVAVSPPNFTQPTFFPPTNNTFLNDTLFQIYAPLTRGFYGLIGIPLAEFLPPKRNKSTRTDGHDIYSRIRLSAKNLSIGVVSCGFYR